LSPEVQAQLLYTTRRSILVGERVLARNHALTRDIERRIGRANTEIADAPARLWRHAAPDASTLSITKSRELAVLPPDESNDDRAT
jgi:hypothetical protein